MQFSYAYVQQAQPIARQTAGVHNYDCSQTSSQSVELGRGLAARCLLWLKISFSWVSRLTQPTEWSSEKIKKKKKGTRRVKMYYEAIIYNSLNQQRYFSKHDKGAVKYLKTLDAAGKEKERGNNINPRIPVLFPYLGILQMIKKLQDTKKVEHEIQIQHTRAILKRLADIYLI
ncbi:hypothetical protein WN51_04231 [Melipona quadrifasciata]|uniref:Uncharacterized protein n=1 Tax=Melipona quadrifasciata TaxID=166423 RepID=A0A0N0U422_9HYME|nr:hypothetical protein WN51_04231 [Melipona quadrifasciata]